MIAEGWKTGHEDLRPPAWFVRDLARFDPELRIRFSWPEQRFHFERHVGPRALVDPAYYFGPKRHDRYIRARDGYEYVKAMDPDVPFDARIFYALIEGDTRRYGGWLEYLDIVEREEARDREAKRRAASADHEDAAKEMYERLQWDWGARVSMYRPEPPAPIPSKAPRFARVYEHAGVPVGAGS